jgi:hypothetical protein
MNVRVSCQLVSTRTSMGGCRLIHGESAQDIAIR